MFKALIRFFAFLYVNLSLIYAQEPSFDQLMGKDHEVWHYLSESDKALLRDFQKHFENEKNLNRQIAGIPKILHFIWLGPKDFPNESIKNLYSWVDKHPGWQVFFWTDRQRPLLHPKILVKDAENFSFLYLKDLFENSSNWGEKSDLLRYEILYQIGGVYIDHDVICYRPFDDIVEQTDLFCGLEFPHKPLAETALNVCNNLIGAVDHHPIIELAMKWCLEKTPYYLSLYPQADADSVTKRIYHTSFSAFDQAVKKLYPSIDLKTQIYPAGYFNKLGKRYGLYAHHFYQSTWFESEDHFEKNVRQRLVKICKKHNQVLLISAFSFLVLSLLIILLYLQINQIKKSLEEIKKRSSNG